MKVDRVRSFVAFSTLANVLDELQLNRDFALFCPVLFRSYSDDTCTVPNRASPPSTHSSL